MTIEEARSVLGDMVRDWTDQEVQNHVTSLEFLIDGWLETYERSIFEGRTLKQLLTTMGRKEISWV